MKPRPFVVPWSVNIERLDRVFIPTIYSIKSSSEVRKRDIRKIPTQAEYFVALTLNDRQ